MKHCKLLVLALTGDCNFACRYCYAAEMRRETMDFETAQRALALAAAGGTPFVLQFSGGEPMLAFPLIEEIVRYVEAERIPARMQVQTNGSLLTEERARFLHRHRVGIGVSIDGRAAVHDCLRKLPNGTGSFAAVMRGMEVLRALRIPVGVTAVVSRENVRDLPGLAELAYYLGNVRRIGLDLLRGQGRGRGLVPAGEAETAAAVTALCRRLDELAALTGIRIALTQTERCGALVSGRMEAFEHCFVLRGEAAFVQADGGIYACSSFFGDPRFYLGDVMQGISEERAQAVAALVYDGMARCRACDALAACGGGCFARMHGAPAGGAECGMKRAVIAHAAGGA
ncbi:radical SAM protein [Selenomonas sp. F0473]|uniref:radical SAM/SPASM domain-containing protein n=1 Tax=Selenomonas sp. F0473 TaxID=999423 RepID=UPI00029E9BC4|nr:radical SAM protein [Selenomonas sp. F0473]EKU72146.1 radical SAM additional 4Fe4S-binding domain-containing protein [Selenomonas sp. F0473]